MKSAVTLAVVLRDGVRRLEQRGISDAALEARVLLQDVLRRPREWIALHRDQPVADELIGRYHELIEARSSGEPLAYLVGEREFYGRPFAVDRRVLIPRPESEGLVELGRSFARRQDVASPRIADVGTGSGVLAVTLALELPRARIVAVEVSRDALTVARANALRHGVVDRVTFVVGDLFAPLGLRFDLIVANLPYVPSAELDRAPAELGQEPRLALDGGPTGLDRYQRFFHRAPAHLATRGALFAEIGWDQGEAAAELARLSFPNRKVSILPDLEGRDRVVAVEPE